MSKKHFYHHFIGLDTLETELDSLLLQPEEKLHLTTLIKTNIHYTVLDVVLTNLSGDDKKIFIEHIDNHAQTWEFLRGKIQQIDDKISQSIAFTLKKFIADIADVKKTKKRAKK